MPPGDARAAMSTSGSCGGATPSLGTPGMCSRAPTHRSTNATVEPAPLRQSFCRRPSMSSRGPSDRGWRHHRRTAIGWHLPDTNHAAPAAAARPAHHPHPQPRAAVLNCGLRSQRGTRARAGGGDQVGARPVPGRQGSLRACAAAPPSSSLRSRFSLSLRSPLDPPGPRPGRFADSERSSRFVRPSEPIPDHHPGGHPP